MFSELHARCIACPPLLEGVGAQPERFVHHMLMEALKHFLAFGTRERCKGHHNYKGDRSKAFWAGGGRGP